MSAKEEKEIKSKNLLGKIRSKYILKQIFTFLHKKSFLKLPQYNKQLQRAFNLSIIDCEKYCEIEIEIRLNGYGKFINIPKKDIDKSYFHIYFDENKEEELLKRDYIQKDEKSKKLEYS